MMSQIKLAAVVLCLLGLMTFASAAMPTINVPADYATIQAAVDASINGDTINVYPGSYTSEHAEARNPNTGGAGANDFNLFIDKEITIQGVDASGIPITNPENTLATIQGTYARPTFGYSSVFVQANNVTIKGVKILAPTAGADKTLEIAGNNSTIQYCNIDGADSCSIYISRFNAEVESYNFSNCIFTHGGLYIASGAGRTGGAGGRVIADNIFADNDVAIIFAGITPGVGWLIEDVGAANITNNSFIRSGRRHVMSWGTNDPALDYTSILTNNTFDKAAVPWNGGEVRTWESGTSFFNIKAIYAGLQLAIDRAQNGDKVQALAGIYAETITVAKELTIEGAGDEAVGTIVNGAGMTVSASDVAISKLWMKGTSLSSSNGVAASGTIDNLSLTDVTCTNNFIGVHVPAAATVTDLSITNCKLNANNGAFTVAGKLTGFVMSGCEVNGNYTGIRAQDGTTSLSPNLIFSDVTISNTIFDTNYNKGMYLEKLNNATFTNITMNNCGNNFGSYYKAAAGIDINCKDGVYSNIVISNSLINNCGNADTVNGFGLTIKARDDGGYAAPHQATLDTVTLSSVTITNCLSGLGFGEPNKYNAGPTNVTMNGCSFADNANYIIRNHSKSDVIATSCTFDGLSNDAIEALVLHKNDDAVLGLVNWGDTRRATAITAADTTSMGGSALVSARLTIANVPISGATLTFKCGAVSANVTTDLNGTATATLATGSATSYAVYFAGTPNYTAASDSAAITVLSGKTLTWNQATKNLMLDLDSTPVNADGWYTINTTTNARVFVDITKGLARITGVITQFDADGVDGGSSPVVSNSVYYNWQLKSGAVFRLYQSSTVGAESHTASYYAASNQTLVDNLWYNGAYKLGILASDTGTLTAIVMPY